MLAAKPWNATYTVPVSTRFTDKAHGASYRPKTLHRVQGDVTDLFFTFAVTGRTKYEKAMVIKQPLQRGHVMRDVPADPVQVHVFLTFIGNNVKKLYVGFAPRRDPFEGDASNGQVELSIQEG